METGRLSVCVVQVNWDSEKDCFRDFSRECSMFYSIRKQFVLEAEPGAEQVRGVASGISVKGCEMTAVMFQEAEGSSWRWKVEHVIFKALRTLFSPPKMFSEDGAVLQIANLPDLFKVFERC